MFNKPQSNYLTLDFSKLKIKDEETVTPSTNCRSNSTKNYLRKLRLNGVLTERQRSENTEYNHYTQKQLIFKKEFEEQKKEILNKLRKQVDNQQIEFEKKKKDLIGSRRQVNSVLRVLMNSQSRFKEYKLGDEIKLYSQYYRCMTTTPQHLKNTIYDPQKYQNYYGKLQKSNLKLNHQVQFAMISYRKQLEETQQRIPNFLKSIQQVL